MALNEKAFGQQFVVDILTKYHDAGLRQAQEAQVKLREVLSVSTAAFGAASVAANKHSIHLNTLSSGLEKLNKLTWLGVASGNVVGKVFSGIADYAAKAAAKVAVFGEELYYMNRRLSQPGTGGLFNFAFAAQQIGLSPEQGLGAIESMGAAVRTNPGLAALLGRFLPGYKPGNQLGAPETLGLVNQLKGQFGEKGYFVAAQLAQEFGVGEHEFRQMWTNVEELNAQYAIHGARLKDLGLDTDKSSKSFIEFNRALHNLLDVIELTATKVGAWLADYVGTPVLKAMMPFGRVVRVAELAATWAAPGAAPIPRATAPIPRATAPENLSSAPKEAAIQRFMKMGLNREAAIGAMTGLTGESGQSINPRSINAQSGAAGIANWLGARKRNFASMFGHPIEQSTNEEQWQFLEAELHGFGDPQTARAYKLLQSPDMTAGKATNIWENMVERHGDNAYTAKLMLQSQAYARANPSGSGTTQNFDVDHTVTVNIHGNADEGVMKDAGRMLGQDKWDQGLRQATRSDNFR